MARMLEERRASCLLFSWVWSGVRVARVEEADAGRCRRREVNDERCTTAILCLGIVGRALRDGGRGCDVKVLNGCERLRFEISVAP